MSENPTSRKEREKWGTRLSAASPTATVFSECFDFHLGMQITGPSPCSFLASSGDNGNVNQIVNNRDNTRTQTAYDSLNRIASAQSSGTQWGETFTIDPWGNMTNEAGIAGKTVHEGLNTSAGPNNQLSGFGYDAAGNMTSNGSTTYVYDAENRLVWTSGYRYIYDGAGQRVEKCAAASATTACPTSGATGTLYWRGIGSDTLAETDLGGNDQEEYIFFNGERIARRDTTSTGTTIAVHYYFSDHLGSHGVVESATGTTCEQDIDYYPYGGVENDYCSSTAVAQNYKFNGKERDSESGLDNFGARYDASALGRFMTPDGAAKPVTVPYAKFGDPQSLNLYSFVENGPVNRIDADGHVEWAPNIDFSPGQVVNVGAATAEAAGGGGGMGGVPYSETMVTDSMQQAQNRQPDGSYKATPAQLAKIKEAADKKTTIGNGQCVTACERFTGVPGPTSLWEGGKPASKLTDKDKGTAIATFVQGPDGKWRYLPDANGHMNSGTFMSKSTNGTFWMADQWPQGKPVTIWNVTSNPNNASMNAASYRVIVVPNP